MSDEKEMAQTLVAFNQKFIGLKRELLALVSIYQIYAFGHKIFDRATHLSVASPDDFISSRLGEVNADLFSDSCSTNLVDLPALTRTRKERAKENESQNESESEIENEIGLNIVYVDQRLRPSVRYGRLCQALRSGKSPYLILGNSKFIESSFLPHTISLYIPPTLSSPTRYPNTLAKEEIEKIRNSTKIFWQKHESAVLKKYQNLQAPEWLSKADEDSWPRILAISEVLDNLLGQPIFTKPISALAERIINFRKKDDSSTTLEEKILRATLSFITEVKPMKEDSRFYNGIEMLQYTQTLLDMPRLRIEEISKYLNRHHVIIDKWRPHMVIAVDREGVNQGRKIIDKERYIRAVEEIAKERPNEAIKAIKIIQRTCYQLNPQELTEALNNHFGREK